ncbi:unnamed protein product [Cunninghamella echinulata]
MSFKKNDNYDQVYFDSDEEIDSEHTDIKGGDGNNDPKQVKSNEELFYDPLVDEMTKLGWQIKLKRQHPKKTNLKKKIH